MPSIKDQERDIRGEVLEFLKDCRVMSISQEMFAGCVMVWRVEYVIDPDREFSSLDDQERAIKSRCKIRSVSCTQDGSGQTNVEVEWI